MHRSSAEFGYPAHLAYHPWSISSVLPTQTPRGRVRLRLATGSGRGEPRGKGTGFLIVGQLFQWIPRNTAKTKGEMVRQRSSEMLDLQELPSS
jgi:hypothetical protein